MDTYRGPNIPSLVCSYMKLSCMVDLTCAASGLTFDDNSKQKQYETISFSSIYLKLKRLSYSF
jgi:hypothetical protein